MRQTLDQFLGYLKDQTAESFKGKAIDQYMSELDLSADALAPFTFFRDDTYARNLVHRTDLFELMVIAWLPKNRTPIHDHFGQRCWMRVEEGTLTFRNYAPLKDGQGPLEPIGGCDTVCSKKTTYIDDGMAVHSITNASTKPAVSMHLYAGPIPRCQIYNEATQAFEWKELEYFTVSGEPTGKVRTEFRLL